MSQIQYAGEFKLEELKTIQKNGKTLVFVNDFLRQLGYSIDIVNQTALLNKRNGKKWCRFRWVCFLVGYVPS